MTLAVQPRFVPTLTEIVAPPELPRSLALSDVNASVETLPEALAHRISERVKLALESSLRTAVSKLIAQQMEALTPLLVEEVERLVREAVTKALEQEDVAAQTVPVTPPPG